MLKHVMSLLAPFLLFMTVYPAYAEVSSLQTDRTFYSIDMTIYFTGTVQPADSQKLVNLMIQDPNGKIVLMTGKIAESDNTFHISINTNDQNQFYLKGIYSATAFVNGMSGGKTIHFDFSPDGSPVYHTTTESQNVGQASNGSNSFQPSYLKHYESVLYENTNLSDAINNSKKIQSMYGISKQPSIGYDVENIVYPLMAACGAGIVVLVVYRKRKRSKGMPEKNQQTLPVNDTYESDYAMMILKNRLAKGEI